MDITLQLKTPSSSIDVHPIHPKKICLGFLDGAIGCYTFNSNSGKQEMFRIEENWKNRLKKAVRASKFSIDGTNIYATSSNRAVCMFDTEIGKKMRCIREGHKSRPNALSLTSTINNGQQFATGAENGEVKLWDFRQMKPEISSFNDQEDIINSLCTWKNLLLAASGDGTLVAYDLRKQKMVVQSEAMHSELLTLAVTDRFTYAGAADGHIEVFNNGEYGNIRERIETPMLMGVEQLLLLRNNLLLAAASTQEEMKFIHINPNKCLQDIPYPGGIDLLTKTADSESLLVTSADGTKLSQYFLAEILEGVPELRAQDMRKFKDKQKEDRKRKKPSSGNFFQGLLNDQEDESSDE